MTTQMKGTVVLVTLNQVIFLSLHFHAVIFCSSGQVSMKTGHGSHRAYDEPLSQGRDF